MVAGLPDQPSTASGLFEDVERLAALLVAAASPGDVVVVDASAVAAEVELHVGGRCLLRVAKMWLS